MVVLTRDAALGALRTVTCAPITRTIRGIRSEVEVGRDEGLPQPGVITCDNLLIVGQAALYPKPIGRLRLVKRIELDRGLRYALDIAY